MHTGEFTGPGHLRLEVIQSQPKQDQEGKSGGHVTSLSRLVGTKYHHVLTYICAVLPELTRMC